MEYIFPDEKSFIFNDDNSKVVFKFIKSFYDRYIYGHKVGIATGKVSGYPDDSNFRQTYVNQDNCMSLDIHNWCEFHIPSLKTFPISTYSIPMPHHTMLMFDVKRQEGLFYESPYDPNLEKYSPMVFSGVCDFRGNLRYECGYFPELTSKYITALDIRVLSTPALLQLLSSINKYMLKRSSCNLTVTNKSLEVFYHDQIP